MKNILDKIYRSTRLVNDLSKKDLQLKYYGSFLGVSWAFIHPVIMITILWFVFQVGFKSIPVNNVPFIVWLVAGMVPWFYISEIMSSGTSAVTENTYLVKKIVFKTELLPLVKILTALKIHLFFIVMMLIIYLIYGYSFNLYNIQLLYYVCCSIVLSASIVYITASLNVFFKDTSQLMVMLTQFGFWITPIFWSLSLIPEKYELLIKINPVYYIVEGYRTSLFTHEVILDHPNLMLYFWIVNLLMLTVGLLLFKKLKPHFADVL
jgi:teichoic acid transport system permease protein